MAGLPRTLVAALLAACTPAAAAPLALPAIPLSLSNEVAPNIMLMVDNSDAMSHVVAQPPEGPDLQALPPESCPAANRVPQGVRVDLNIRAPSVDEGNGPRIAYDGARYDWGTGSGQRCFAPDVDYEAALNLEREAARLEGEWYVPAIAPTRYPGHYLNWYFDPGNYAAPDYVGSDAIRWNAGQLRKPLPVSLQPQGKVLSRIEVARSAAQTLVAGLDSRLRVGLSAHDGKDGGALRVPVAALTPAQRTALGSGPMGIAHIEPGGSAPLAETLSAIGRYFATGYSGALAMNPKDPPREVTRTVAQAFPANLSGATSAAPVVLSCQPNFAILLSAGRSSEDHSSSQLAIGAAPDDVIRDYDGDCQGRSPACGSHDRKPDQDYGPDGSDYLDDVAQALHETDLRPDFPAEAGSGQPYRNNIVTHVISLADAEARNDALLVRAARQGGGRFVAAADADALTAALDDLVAGLPQRTAALASISLDSTHLSSGTRLFQAGFDSSGWTGSLRALPIASGTGGSCGNAMAGQPCAAIWEASAVLEGIAAQSRTILSLDSSSRVGIPFRWASLSLAQQALLSRDPNRAAGVTDARGPDRLAWLRGDRSREAAHDLRPRTRLLGDIVHSDPAFVGAPDATLPFAGHAAFRSRHADRMPMVYVGANDGMLHGFRASDGVERLAYVPGPMFGTAANPKLARLSAQPYLHVWGVDGSPTVGDVQVGADRRWATYLVGSLRYGGQGLFALDVTDPQAFSEARAASIVRWEFTDADDPDLGYTFSQPSLVKLKNSRWAVLVGNGYNNREADGSVSTAGRAALFILLVDGPGADGRWDLGTDYFKLEVGPRLAAAETDNGLATPAAVDLDGDQRVDYVYAGDLRGDMWQFNLNDADPGRWAVGYGGNPVFTARSGAGVRQPITAPAEVGFNLLSSDPDDLVVFVGTGRYFASGDHAQANQQNQTFYGIFVDPIASPDPLTETLGAPDPGRPELLRQTVLQEVSAGGRNLRISSNRPLDMARHRGWYIDLYNTQTAGADPSPASGLNKGERQVSRPVLRDGRVVFTTLLPSATSCDAGGSGWLMEVDASTGARPREPALDITQDLNVDVLDRIEVRIGGETLDVPVSGIGSPSGMLSTPAILALRPGQDAKYSTRSDGGIALFAEARSRRTGRVTWREWTP